jgi:quercetin dioxygenase-like cupin family protein
MEVAMTVVNVRDVVTHEVHGTTFHSYITSADGASLCAWQLVVPPDQEGVIHRPDRDEVILVLTGQLKITLNGDKAPMAAGEVLLVRAGDEFRACGGPEGATAWVTTTPGLTATLGDGTELKPPWAQ